MGFGRKGTDQTPAHGTPEEWWDKSGRASPSWGKPPVEKKLGACGRLQFPGGIVGALLGTCLVRGFGEERPWQLLLCKSCSLITCLVAHTGSSAPGLVRSNPNCPGRAKGGGAGLELPGSSKSRHITGGLEAWEGSGVGSNCGRGVGAQTGGDLGSPCHLEGLCCLGCGAKLESAASFP